MPDAPLLVGALWLGLLTSISPCPLATNIAAVAYLARRGSSRTGLAGSCGAYIAGRMTSYIVLALVLAAGVFSAPELAAFLRVKVAGLIGPGLIVLGMLVAGWLSFGVPGFGGLNALGTQLAARGVMGEFLMGVVFALAFCPVSAALFFGGLMPAVIQSGAGAGLPLAYGVGTALPVIAAAVIWTFGVNVAAVRLKRLQDLGAWLQKATAWVLMAVGAWLTVRDLIA